MNPAVLVETPSIVFDWIETSPAHTPGARCFGIAPILGLFGGDGKVRLAKLKETARAGGKEQLAWREAFTRSRRGAES